MLARFKTSIFVIALIAVACAYLYWRHSNVGVEGDIAETLDRQASEQARQYSQKTEKFLSDYDRELEDQERAREEARVREENEAKEKLVRSAVDQSLDELLSLDPGKDAVRVKQLTKDLVEMGRPAVGAITMMLGEDRPTREKILLTGVLGAFKGSDASDALFAQASSSRDARIMQSAIDKLKKADLEDKQRLEQKAIAMSRRSEAESGGQSLDAFKTSIGLMGAVGGDAAVSRLDEIIRTSSDPDVRIRAVLALGGVESDAAERILENLFESDADLRVAAAQALGSRRNEEIVLRFGEILANGQSAIPMRLAAVEGLGADNGPAARRILMNVLWDARQPKEVHQSTVNVLVKELGSAAPAEEIQRYVFIFKSTEVEYLPQMMQPLLALGGDVCAGLLFNQYDRLNNLKKIHAIRVLSKIQSPKAFSYLESLLSVEKDSSLRTEIVSAMKNFKDKAYTEKIRSIMIEMARAAEKSQDRIQMLRLLSDVSPDDASQIAADWIENVSDRDVVLACIDVLKKCGNTSSANALRSLRMQDATGEYGPKIDDALKAIEARGR